MPVVTFQSFRGILDQSQNAQGARNQVQLCGTMETSGYCAGHKSSEAWDARCGGTAAQSTVPVGKEQA